MRAFLLITALLLFLPCSALAEDDFGSAAGEGFSESAEGAEEDVKGEAEQTMADAESVHNEAVDKRFEDSIPSADEINEQASECFDGIMDADFGLSLDVPSISNLLGAACNEIENNISNEFNQANDTVSADAFDGMLEVEAGEVTSGGVDYDEQGETAAEEMMNEIEPEDSTPWKD